MIRSALGLGFWAGLLVVVTWWVTDGGLHSLTAWASALTSLGRISGLAAAQLLLIQVLLMSRAPWLEHAFGRIQLVRLHRRVGLWSFGLMLAHVAAIVVGYASARWTLIPVTLWELITRYAGMLLATAGFLCLIMVVATSLRAGRRRLRYESWHLLHLYAYLGAGLALPHQLWTGQEFATRPAARVYWWGLWISAAGAVLVWRLGLPLWRAFRHRLRVEATTWEAPDVVSVNMSGRRLDRLAVEPGQFINVRFLTRPGWTRANPFSLSAAADGRTVRITAKIVGDGTARIARLRRGTPVLFEGPYGRLTARSRSRRKVLLAGAGSGITPLRALAEGLDYQPGEATLIQRHTGVPLFVGELDRLRVERGLAVIDLAGQRSSARSTLGPTVEPADEIGALQHMIPDLTQHDVYLCGPTGWTSGMIRLLTLAQVPKNQIHIESFGWWD